MAIGDFNVLSVAVYPPKADTELVINADRVLSGAVAFQRSGLSTKKYHRVRLTAHLQMKATYD